MTELKICKQREVTVYNDGLAETRQVPVCAYHFKPK